jgi:4-hydroxybenzoate polyprenyltransferase
MARPISPEDTVPGAPAKGGAGGRSTAVLLLHSLRPEQWTKNLIVFAGLIFGLELFDRTAVLRSLLAFAVFCALSGVVYIFNDIMDREADRRHPLKARRPIASGALSPSLAGGVAAALAAVALAAAFALGIPFGVVALSCVLLQAACSGPLKRIVIVDVLAIAIGFVLRAAAGLSSSACRLATGCWW